MTGLNYCVNGCTIRHGDTWDRTTTEGRSQLCRQCEDRLHQWLTKIPDLYALLPSFVEHGSTEPDPDGRTSSNPTPPAPMRLDVIDLLDTRYGRRWHGTEPTEDRRGVLGSLKVHTDRLREERPLTTVPDPTDVTTAAKLLDKHRLWLAEQDWVNGLYEEIKQVYRTLNDAIGNYRRPPVGRCHIEDDDGTPCGGPLFANEYGGVRCARCQATWDAHQLRVLGLAQAGVHLDHPETA